MAHAFPACVGETLRGLPAGSGTCVQDYVNRCLPKDIGMDSQDRRISGRRGI